MSCDPSLRESFLVRFWSEPDRDQHVVRGSIQNVRTGHLTYFQSLDLPLGLLRESAERLAFDDRPALS
jgi:hypothetical protein